MTLRRVGQRATGAVAPMAPTFRRASAGLAVFVFHDVDDQPAPYASAAGIAVGVERFRRQLDWIESRFELVHPDALVVGRVPPRAALLTFDDGYASVVANAVPELERRGAGAVLFLNMDVVGGAPQAAAAVDLAWGTAAPPVTPGAAVRAVTSLATAGRLDELVAHQGRYLDAAGLADLAGHRLVRFGNHLWNHWYGPALTCAEFLDGVARNDAALRTNRGALPWLAFTNGAGPARLRRHATEQGQIRLFTGAGVVNPDASAALLHRVDLADRITDRLLFRSALASRTAAGRPRHDNDQEACVDVT